MSRRRLAAMVATAAVALFLAWWLLGDRVDPDVASEPARVARRQGPAPRPTRAPSPAPSPVVDAPPADLEPAEQALAVAFPQRQVVECPAGTLTEGQLLRFQRPTPYDPSASGVLVSDGVLRAAVDTPDGEGLLLSQLAPVAALRWWGAIGGTGQCSVDPVPTTTVRGVVIGGGEGLQVRTCSPTADAAPVGPDGSFAFEAAVGQPCRIFAFVSDERGFAAGPRADVGPIEAGMPAVELDAPAEAPRTAEDFDDAYATWLLSRESVQNATAVLPSPLLDADLEALDPEARAQVERLQQQHQALTEEPDRLIQERLDAGDPDAWLLLY